MLETNEEILDLLLSEPESKTGPKTTFYKKMGVCSRCLGRGKLYEFRHIAAGECFKCGGTGEEEIGEYSITKG